MIDHVVVKASAALFGETVKFYEKALEPLGYTKMREIPSKAAGFGDQTPDFWVFASIEETPSVHVALRAKDRESIREFYVAAIKAGASDNGEPGVRKQLHENYYAAASSPARPRAG